MTTPEHTATADVVVTIETQKHGDSMESSCGNAKHRMNGQRVSDASHAVKPGYTKSHVEMAEQVRQLELCQ